VLEAGLAEGVLAAQGAWSLTGRSLTVATQTDLTRQLIVVALLLLLLAVTAAIQLAVHHRTHFAAILFFLCTLSRQSLTYCPYGIRRLIAVV